ncbi:MAG: helix-turn-helix domain-containing protein [Nitrospira sp.]|nr:helix-turn-helix domain-containing protein [Nitrospira sp.]
MSKNGGIDGDNGSHDVQVKVGQRVRMLRKARGWSQEELAARALLHPTYIGSIERGERNVSLVNLAKLSEAFEMTLRDLLTFSLHDQDKEGIQEKQIRELVAGSDRLAIAFFQTFCQKCETLKRFRALQALIPDQKE